MKAFIECEYCGARLIFDPSVSFKPELNGWKSIIRLPSNGNYTCIDSSGTTRFEIVMCGICVKERKKNNG